MSTPCSLPLKRTGVSTPVVDVATVIGTLRFFSSARHAAPSSAAYFNAGAPVAAGIGVPAGAASVGEVDAGAGISFQPGVGVSMIVAGNAAAFEVGASVHDDAGAALVDSYAMATERGLVRGCMQPRLAAASASGTQTTRPVITARLRSMPRGSKSAAGAISRRRTAGVAAG